MLKRSAAFKLGTVDEEVCNESVGDPKVGSGFNLCLR